MATIPKGKDFDMDWQFKVALASAAVFFLLPYWMKDMPHSITFAGLGAAVLFGLWGLPWLSQKIPTSSGLLLILSCSGVIAAATLIIKSFNENYLKIEVRTNNAEYPTGTLVSGIEFKPNFTEATVLIYNASTAAFADLNLVLRFDEPIVAIAQQSKIPDVTFETKSQADLRIMVKDPTGKVIAVPSVTLLATDVGYRIRCPRLLGKSTIIITAALSDIVQERHPEWKALPIEQQVKIKKMIWTITMSDGTKYWLGHMDGDVFSQRRPPAWLNVEGEYNEGPITRKISQKIDFSPMTFDSPKGLLDGIFSIRCVPSRASLGRFY